MPLLGALQAQELLWRERGGNEFTQRPLRGLVRLLIVGNCGPSLNARIAIRKSLLRPAVVDHRRPPRAGIDASSAPWPSE